jgi:hypothetical protein
MMSLGGADKDYRPKRNLAAVEAPAQMPNGSPFDEARRCDAGPTLLNPGENGEATIRLTSFFMGFFYRAFF